MNLTFLTRHTPANKPCAGKIPKTISSFDFPSDHASCDRPLDKVGNVHGHLSNLGIVELLDIAQVANISLGKEVDGNTLTTETAGTTDTVDVVLTVGGEVKVDDQGNLLDIDTTGQKVGGDEDTGRSRAELAHDDVTLALVHVSVHAGDGEVPLLHLLLEPVDLSPGVAVNDGLGDGERLVEIAEGVELPLLAVNGDVELLDTLEGKLVLLDEDTDGVAHESLGNLEDVEGHGRREEADLDLLGEELEDVIDLVLETTGKHLIGLIEHELTDVVETEGATVDHVVDTAGGTDDDVNTALEDTDVITDGGTTDAGMDLDLHVVTESDDDLLDLLGQLTGGGKDEGLALTELGIKLAKGTDGEGGGLALLC